MFSRAFAIAMIVASGPAVAKSGCHPSYNPCIAISSDADCIPPPDQRHAGNGPIYAGYGYQRHNDFLRVGSDDVGHMLVAKYTTCVPVVVIDGHERFRGRVNEVLLRRLLSGR